MKLVQDHKVKVNLSIARKTRTSICSGTSMIWQLDPVAQVLDTCQIDKCVIDDACQLKLLSSPVFQPHIKLIEKCFKQAVLDEHLVTYILHPLYRGAILTKKASMHC